MKHLSLILGAFCLNAIPFAAHAYDGNPCCIPQQRDPIICFYDCIKFTSQSFMFPRPANQNLAMHQAWWHTLLYTENPFGTNIQCIGFAQGSHSTKAEQQYFLFNRLTSLSVRGDNAADANTRDVRAEWLGISNNDFRGTLQIKPKQKQFGFSIEVYQDLGGLIDWNIFDNWWITARIPFIAVVNEMNLMQSGVSNPGNPNSDQPFDILSAFSQPRWRYAKMDDCKRSRVSPAELNIHLGSTYLGRDYFEMAYYSGLSVPLSGSACSEYLFSPFVGNNGHVSVEGGINIQITLNCDTSCAAYCFYTDLEVHWLFANEQCRTFDLLKKPWSRYLLLNKKDGPPDQNVPGVNVLTREVHVSPYSMAEFSAGWRYINDFCEAEVGYLLWGHGNEHLELKCPFEEVWGIAGRGSTIDPVTGATVATSASKSTIAQQALDDVDAQGDPIFITIKAGDINLLSAQSRTAINHQVHAAIAYTHNGCTLDAFVGFGAFYEWAQRNSALQQWGFWAKFGAGF